MLFATTYKFIKQQKTKKQKTRGTKPNPCKTDETTSQKAYTILNMGRKMNKKTNCQENPNKSEHR